MGSYQQQIKEPTSQDHAEDVLYTIKKSDYVGRYIVASRDIKPGENIFSDKPACIGRLHDLKYKVEFTQPYTKTHLLPSIFLAICSNKIKKPGTKVTTLFRSCLSIFYH